MPNDYKQKEPSKTERMLYELAMAQNQMEKGLWSTSTVVMALALITKAKPEEVAALMYEDSKIKEFSEKVNAEIKRLEAEKHKDHKHSNEPGEEEMPKAA
jgi:hypothetical protein